MFSLNMLSRGSGAGAPADPFLGGIVKSFLPNSGGKVLSLRREIKKHKREQDHWMEKLGRGSTESFQIWDEVSVHDALSRQWRIKGTVTEVIDHNPSSSKTYKVLSDYGYIYLRNGKFIMLCLSKLHKKSITWHPSVKGCLL